jgi:hypothetical protein
MTPTKLVLASALVYPFGLISCTKDVIAHHLRVYTPSQVVANAKKLRGQTVHVRGYLLLGDEAHNLWDSQKASEEIRTLHYRASDPAWDRCISVYYNEMGAKAIGRSYPRYLVAIGRIEIRNKENSVDFGACNEVSITIEDVEGSRL